MIFATSARALATVAAAVRPDQWDAPAMGEWDVRALVGHALRAVTTPVDYLAVPAHSASLDGPGEYIRTALSTPDIHTSVAARGREAGAALGDDPASVVAETVEHAVPIIATARLDAVLTLPFGTITLADYLPTRILELVAHTDDLCRAIDHPSVATELEVALVLSTLAVAVDRDRGLEVMRAQLGRAPLPEHFNLWG